MNHNLPSRRELLVNGGAGFGALALCHLLGDLLPGAETKKRGHGIDDIVIGRPHHTPHAKSVIFLFMEGGPSHIDLFDPKPKLDELAGQPLPESFGPVITPMGEYNAPLLATKRKWKQHGEAGTWVSDWLPHTAECVDDIAVIRSCWANGLNHSNGVCQMNTGSILGGRPSLGSWVTYGLGTENDSLPAFVVIEDNYGKVVNGPRNWGTGFMPAAYQGTSLQSGDEPIQNLETPAEVGPDRQAGKLELAQRTEPPPHGAARPPDGARSPDQELRAGVPDAGGRAGGGRPQPRIGRDRGAVRHQREGNGRVRPQLPAGPAAGRARRPLRAALSRRRQQVGRPQRHRGEPRHELQGKRQAGCRAC